MYKIIFKPHEWLSLYYSVLVVLFVWVEPTPIANLPERLREETGVWWRTDVRKVPFCSPAEIEGQKCSPKRVRKNLKKCEISMLLDVFYHKLIHLKVYIGVLKALIVNNS